MQWDTFQRQREDDCDHSETAAQRLHLRRVLLPRPADDSAVGQAHLGGHDDGHQRGAPTENAGRNSIAEG